MASTMERVAEAVQEAARLPEDVEGQAVGLPQGVRAETQSQPSGPLLVLVDEQWAAQADDAALAATVRERQEADEQRGWGW